MAAAAMLWMAGAAAAFAGEVAGTIRGPDGRPLRDAVVFVTGVRTAAPARRTWTMDQRRRTFIPHVMVIQLGDTVLFPNNDTVFHNVFSFREGKRFDLGLYPVGTTERQVFDTPGLARLFCNIHSNMSAYIWVVENPYFGQTGTDGAYRLRNVPPGRYTIRVWHARAGERLEAAVVETGETRLDVELRGR
jgi:plastocyanin